MLVADLSSLDRALFWVTLENRRWTWPYDANVRRIAFGAMPKQYMNWKMTLIAASLALVREAGGDEKTTVPLEEFRWADLFRALIAAPATDDEFDASVRRGMDIARSELAIGLPGFLGKKKPAA